MVAAPDLPKSTAIRLLNVMEEEGFVRRFRRAPAYSIGHAARDRRELPSADMAEVTAPVLGRLADEVGFTTNLGMLEGPSVLHLHVAEPQRALRFATGGTLDYAYCTGLGKMLMSVLADDEIDAHLPESEPYASWTPHTLTTRAEISPTRAIRRTAADRRRGAQPRHLHGRAGAHGSRAGSRCRSRPSGA